MVRKSAWLAVCGVFFSGAMAFAQGTIPYPAQPAPFGNPAVNGYPGAAAPTYGPRIPTYGQPNVTPNAPYSVPLDDGPRKDATEPYFVVPQKVPSGKPVSQEAKGPPTSMGEAVTRVAQIFTPSEPSEPYTTYEGRRYAAETRLDNTRGWAQVDFVHWWTRRVNTPPLVTTGTTGAIGANDTQVLLGNGPLGPNEFSGIRATFGIWLDQERLQSLELGGFWLGSASRQYSVTSDANGNPALFRPIQVLNQVPVEQAFVFAFPGFGRGGFAVNTTFDLHGAELNLVRNVLRINGWSLDTIVGARYLYLNDTITMTQNETAFPGANVFFLGNPNNAASVRVDESFNVTNRFYGAQFGGRVNWAWQRFDIGGAFKVGLGAAQHVAIIDGSTTLRTAAGVTSVAPGGLLAQATNIGRQNSTDFSVVPQLDLTAGYQITERLRFMVSYNLLHWNRIQRASTLIDRQVDLSQVPSDPTFNPATPVAHPFFYGTRTDFWAQGVNVGMELKF